MPVTHKGQTIFSLAQAIGEVILLGDPEAEVIRHFDKSFVTQDEGQDAARDRFFRRINRWYVTPFRRRSEREDDIRQCETEFSMHRRRTLVFYLYFYYSARFDFEGYRDESAEASREFFQKMETIEDEFSTRPFFALPGNAQSAHHTDLQLESIQAVNYRREPCLKATYQLQAIYTDFVKKT